MPKKIDWHGIVKAHGYESELAMWDDLFFAQGLSLAGAADVICLSIPTVRARTRKLGYSRPKGLGPFIPWERLARFHGFKSALKLLQAWYVDEGLGYRPVAARLGLSDTTIMYKIKALGIQPHPRGGDNGIRGYPRSIRSRLKAMPPEQVLALWPRDLAEMYGTTPNTISAYLSEMREAGLLPRSRANP